MANAAAEFSAFQDEVAAGHGGGVASAEFSMDSAASTRNQQHPKQQQPAAASAAAIGSAQQSFDEQAVLALEHRRRVADAIGQNDKRELHAEFKRKGYVSWMKPPAAPKTHVPTCIRVGFLRVFGWVSGSDFSPQLKRSPLWGQYYSILQWRFAESIGRGHTPRPCDSGRMPPRSKGGWGMVPYFQTFQ